MNELLAKAIKANQERGFHSHFEEHPKAACYAEDAVLTARQQYEALLGKRFEHVLTQGEEDAFLWVESAEVSPFTQEKNGVLYPLQSPTTYLSKAETAAQDWRKKGVDERTTVLVEALETSAQQFHLIALAAQHTTGQAFGLAFQQASAHAADHALAVIATAYTLLSKYPERSNYVRPLGTVALKNQNSFSAVGKGIGLVLAGSNAPVAQSLPAIFANLMVGNSVLVKAHPSAVLPLALWVRHIQAHLNARNINPNVIQLAVESAETPIAAELMHEPSVSVIDVCGKQETINALAPLLRNKLKTVFVAPPVVNQVIIHGSPDLREAMRNLAWSICLHSGQMCGAPQNIYIPSSGVFTKGGEVIATQEVISLLKNEISSIVLDKRRGGVMMGAVRNEQVKTEVEQAMELADKVILAPLALSHPHFEKARMQAPVIIGANKVNTPCYQRAYDGPVCVIIETHDIAEAVKLAIQCAQQTESHYCAAYTNVKEMTDRIATELTNAGIHSLFNLIGFQFANQTRAFTDIYAAWGDPDFISRRFKWVQTKQA